MIRSIVYCLPLILFLLSVAVIDAQQPKKMARIGYLTLSAANSEWDEVFKQALRDIGWIEGQNVRFDYHWLAGKTERVPAVAEELIRAKVDVIFSMSTPITDAIKKTTSTILIIMPAIAEPFETGFAASESGATRRQHYRAIFNEPGTRGKTLGAATGNFAAARTCHVCDLDAFALHSTGRSQKNEYSGSAASNRAQ